MNETGYIVPKGRYVPPVLFNPYTGEQRDARDIASDPHGVLIVPPAVMLAAAPQAPAAPTWDQLREMAVKHGAWVSGYVPFATELLATYGRAPEDQPHWVAQWMNAVRAMRAAPAAPAVDAELLELAQAIVKFNREHGSVLAVHINNLADLVDERAAQAAAKGEHGNG